MLRRLSGLAALGVLVWAGHGTVKWLDRRNVARHLSGAQAAYQEGRFDEAFRLVKLPSDRGLRDAQVLHGRMLHDGQGTPEPDYAAAYRLLEPGAAAGDAQAQFLLGMMNLQGQGRARDYRAGADWSMKAAAHGHDGAMAAIGGLYLHALGVAKNEGTAYGWYLAAAARGNQAAAQKCRELRRELTATEVSAGERTAASVDAFIAQHRK